VRMRWIAAPSIDRRHEFGSSSRQRRRRERHRIATHGRSGPICSRQRKGHRRTFTHRLLTAMSSPATRSRATP
jgi:hypothetical protein